MRTCWGGKSLDPPSELQFATAAVPERERLACWREGIHEPVGLSFEWIGDAPSYARLTLRPFAGWWFGHCVNGPARLARPHSMLGAAPDGYYVVRQFAGEGLYRQAGTEIVAGPGDLVVFDAALPSNVTFDCRHSIRFLSAPRVGLEPLLTDPAVAVNACILGRSGLGALLNAHLDALWDTIGQVDGDTGAALGDHLCQLLALALSNGASKADCARASVSLARRQAALAVIDRSFADCELSASQVAAQLGISRRSLYRLFEEAGPTFAQCVRQRRVAASRHLLVEGRMSITQTAFTCGFDDLSTFNRAFRAHYGMAPRDLRHVLAANGRND